MDLVDGGGAFGDKTGQHQPGARPHIGGLDRCPPTTGPAATSAWWPSVWTSAPRRDKFMDEPEPRLEQVLRDHRRASEIALAR